MGNLTCCMNAQNFPSNSKNIAKLVDSLGQLKLVQLPTTVSELMLENPGFALASVEQLWKTRRIVKMKAHERLLGRKVYLLVPVDVVRSRLSKEQLAVVDDIIIACFYDDMVGRRACGGGGGGVDGLNLENLMKDLNGKSTVKIGRRRGWKPVLEPILEEVYAEIYEEQI